MPRRVLALTQFGGRGQKIGKGRARGGREGFGGFFAFRLSRRREGWCFFFSILHLYIFSNFGSTNYKQHRLVFETT
jgi:hypothetical protein